MDDHDADEWILGAPSAKGRRVFLNGEAVGIIQADAAEPFLALLRRRGPCILAGCERMAELCYAHSAAADSPTEAKVDDTTMRGWEAAVWCLSEVQAAEKNDGYSKLTLIANLKDRIQAALRFGPYERTRDGELRDPSALGRAWADDFNAEQRTDQAKKEGT